jgi:hypothetical protein
MNLDSTASPKRSYPSVLGQIVETCDVQLELQGLCELSEASTDGNELFHLHVGRSLCQSLPVA